MNTSEQSVGLRAQSLFVCAEAVNTERLSIKRVKMVFIGQGIVIILGSE
jgi:hypothetical protein